MKYYTILYLCTLGVMVTLDLLWLGVVARGFYESRIGNLMEFRALPGVLFYLVYGAGILTFVSGTNPPDWKTVATYGALFGFFAYATYDLTNLATLKNWPVSITVVDLLWGVIVTSASATAGWCITKYFTS